MCITLPGVAGQADIVDADAGGKTSSTVLKNREGRRLNLDAFAVTFNLDAESLPPGWSTGGGDPPFAFTRATGQGPPHPDPGSYPPGVIRQYDSWGRPDCLGSSPCLPGVTEPFDGSGAYYYADALAGDGRLFSFAYDGSVCSLADLIVSKVSFRYHLYGPNMGALSVVDATGSHVWSIAGNQENAWKEATIVLHTSGFQIQYSGGGAAYPAIDDVLVACDALRTSPAAPSAPPVLSLPPNAPGPTPDADVTFNFNNIQSQWTPGGWSHGGWSGGSWSRYGWSWSPYAPKWDWKTFGFACELDSTGTNCFLESSASSNQGSGSMEITYNGQDCASSYRIISEAAFRYRMNGVRVGTLSVLDASGTTVWSRSFDHGEDWIDAHAVLATASSSFTLSYLNVYGEQGVVSVDDVAITCVIASPPPPSPSPPVEKSFWWTILSSSGDCQLTNGGSCITYATTPQTWFGFCHARANRAFEVNVTEFDVPRSYSSSSYVVIDDVKYRGSPSDSCYRVNPFECPRIHAPYGVRVEADQLVDINTRYHSSVELCATPSPQSSSDFWTVLSGSAYCELSRANRWAGPGEPSVEGACVTDGPGDYGPSEHCEVQANVDLTLSGTHMHVYGPGVEIRGGNCADYLMIQGRKYCSSLWYHGSWLQEVRPRSVHLRAGDVFTWRSYINIFRDSQGTERPEHAGWEVCASNDTELPPLGGDERY